MKNHSYPDGCGLIQDDFAPSDRSGGLTEWVNKDEKDVHHMLWPSQWPQWQDLNLIEHLLEVLV